LVTNWHLSVNSKEEGEYDMRKNTGLGIVIAAGMLSFGALSASAADSDFNMASCNSKQSYQQYTKETTGQISELKAKETELQALYGNDRYGNGSINGRTVSELNGEIKSLKNKINASAQKNEIMDCYRI
jgi:hypothetical protein